MRILISCIPLAHGKSGISVYMRNLVAALKSQGHQLVLLVESGDSGFFPGCNCVEAPQWTRKALLSMLWHLLVLPWSLRKFKCDFCIVAAANRRAFAFYPVFTVAVVHDLAQYHVKAKYDPLRMLYLKAVLPFFVRRAPRVAAISHSTADDLKRFWKIDPKRIAVVYNGLSLPEKEADGYLAAHGLAPHGYIFYVSRIESPGKNHLNLIAAYELLAPELAARYQLVIAGADWHGAETVRARAACSPRRDHIRFTGFLPPEFMAEAYRNAAVYVFPSFFEGFGLSLIEAMHYGVPCCASKTSSLGEIGRGAALLFDPASPEAIAEALTDILSSPEKAAELVAAGKRRAAEFNWNQHARRMVELYEQR